MKCISALKTILDLKVSSVILLLNTRQPRESLESRLEVYKRHLYIGSCLHEEFLRRLSEKKSGYHVQKENPLKFWSTMPSAIKAKIP